MSQAAQTKFASSATEREFIQQATQLIRQIGNCLRVEFSKPSHSDFFSRFSLNLSKIHFFGVSEKSPCAIVGKASSATAIRQLVRSYSSSNQIPVFFCGSFSAHAAALEVTPEGWGLVVSPDETFQLISSEDPFEFLKELFREKIGLGRLNPFNITQPAEGIRFFGRNDEIKMLRDDVGNNYAIAGPGLIGKSSILLKFKNDLIRKRDPRATDTFTVDFYNLMDKSEEGIATKIGNIVSPKLWKKNKPKVDFERFLRSAVSEFGHLQLLLDEVDEVCRSEIFQILGHESKKPGIRIVMCGRKALLDLMTKSEFSFARRFRLVKPGPLEGQDAAALIENPFRDLGLSVQTGVVNYILEMTGGLPHLIQLYCQIIVQALAKDDLNSVSMNFVKQVEDRELGLYVVNPLLELGDDSRLVACELLNHRTKNFTESDIGSVARHLGVDLDHRELRGLCNELYVQNIISFHRGHYSISNRAMKYFAAKSGLVNSNRS